MLVGIKMILVIFLEVYEYIKIGQTLNKVRRVYEKKDGITKCMPCSTS